ncbi:MAG: Hsp20/alpha crystallin family protein [Dermatophilaceae bacterium]
MHEGMLTIKGERSEEQKEEGKKSFYRSEFRYGMFERTVPLPAGVTEKDVTASYQDGVLEVRVPMPAKEKTKAKIRVQRPE